MKLFSMFEHIWYQCDCRPLIHLKSWMENSRKHYYHFCLDRCVFRMLSHKGNNGDSVNTIRSEAKQEDEKKKWHKASQCMKYNEWYLFMYSTYKRPRNCSMVRRVLLISRSSAPLPQHPPLIWLPLQWNEGQRAAGWNDISPEQKFFKMAKKQEQCDHSWHISTADGPRRENQEEKLWKDRGMHASVSLCQLLIQSLSCF